MTTISSLISNDFLSVRENETLASMFGKMAQQRKTDVFVFASSLERAADSAERPIDEYRGMFTYPYLPFRIDSDDVKVHSVTRAAPLLSEDDSLLRAVQLFYESRHSALPVVDSQGKKFLGVVHAFAVLSKLVNELEGLDKLAVSTVRRPQIVVARFDSNLGEAVELMRREHTDRLPIVDEHGELTGFLSYLDLVENYYSHGITRDEGIPQGSISMAFQKENPSILQLPVTNFMSTREPAVIDERANLVSAVQQLIKEDALSLLMLEDRRPKGIIGLHDMLHAIIGSQVQETMVVQYKGLKDLDIDEYEAAWVRKIISYYVEKFSHYVKGDYVVNVHFKQHDQTGEMHRYTVNVLVDYPGVPIAAEGREWDLSAAVHEAFRNTEAELENRFEERRKPLSVKKLAAQEGNPNLPGDLAAP